MEEKDLARAVNETFFHVKKSAQNLEVDHMAKEFFSRAR